MARRLTIPDDWNAQIRTRYQSERAALGAHHAAALALAVAEERRSEVLAGLDAAVAAARTELDLTLAALCDLLGPAAAAGIVGVDEADVRRATKEAGRIGTAK
jgi:hypothetical protein